MIEWLAALFGGASLELDRDSLAEFERTAQELARATHRKAAEVVREETRLLVQDLIRTTPPFGRIGSLEALEGQYFIGKAAVRRDVRRVFRPVQTLRAWKKPVNPKVKRELERAVRKGDTAAVAEILRLQPNRVISAVNRSTAELHREARDGRGRVPAGFKWFVVLDDASVRDYEQEMFERIGRAKAGWETAARALGLSLPDWIARHNTPGRFRSVGSPDGPALEISNDVQWGEDFDELKIMEKALARREKSMRDRLEQELGHLGHQF